MKILKSRLLVKRKVKRNPSRQTKTEISLEDLKKVSGGSKLLGQGKLIKKRPK